LKLVLPVPTSAMAHRHGLEPGIAMERLGSILCAVLVVLNTFKGQIHVACEAVIVDEDPAGFESPSQP
jgi:hypothetical protein